MKTVKNFLMIYIQFCYVYVKFNEPIKVTHLQKLANQSMLNGALKTPFLVNKDKRSAFSVSATVWE